MSDDELRPAMEILKNGSLPTDENAARELALNKKQCALLDNVLYHMVADGNREVTRQGVSILIGFARSIVQVKTHFLECHSSLPEGCGVFSRATHTWSVYTSQGYPYKL